jgi:hypothetical protein
MPLRQPFFPRRSPDIPVIDRLYPIDNKSDWGKPALQRLSRGAQN